MELKSSRLKVCTQADFPSENEPEMFEYRIYAAASQPKQDFFIAYDHLASPVLVLNKLWGAYQREAARTDQQDQQLRS